MLLQLQTNTYQFGFSRVWIFICRLIWLETFLSHKYLIQYIFTTLAPQFYLFNLLLFCNHCFIVIKMTGAYIKFIMMPKQTQSCKNDYNINATFNLQQAHTWLCVFGKQAAKHRQKTNDHAIVQLALIVRFFREPSEKDYFIDIFIYYGPIFHKVNVYDKN